MRQEQGQAGLAGRENKEKEKSGRSKRAKRAAYQGPPARHRVRMQQGNIEIEKDKSTEAKGRGDNLI